MPHDRSRRNRVPGVQPTTPAPPEASGETDPHPRPPSRTPSTVVPRHRYCSKTQRRARKMWHSRPGCTGSAQCGFHQRLMLRPMALARKYKDERARTWHSRPAVPFLSNQLSSSMGNAASRTAAPKKRLGCHNCLIQTRLPYPSQGSVKGWGAGVPACQATKAAVHFILNRVMLRPRRPLRKRERARNNGTAVPAVYRLQSNRPHPQRVMLPHERLLRKSSSASPQPPRYKPDYSIPRKEASKAGSAGVPRLPGGKPPSISSSIG